MLLVDALYLNSPGGLTLLKYLYKELAQRGITSFFLLDKRTENYFSYFLEPKITFLESTLVNRKQFYLQHKNDFSGVLCFSNIPPPIPLSIPSYTLFHNVLLLQDCRYLPFKSRILLYLKRQFIFFLRNNSKIWIVQTVFMKELLMTKLRIPSTNVEVLPFFCLSEQINPLISTKSPNSFIFPSTGLSHKNHFVLLKTWELLHQEGHNFELHLTIPETDYKLIKLISNLKAKGLKILNHGIITQRELLTLYRSSEYLVYPSLNESFGLPLIEAIQQNCKVIAADLPYSKETIIPTAKFNPYQPSSLKNAILKVTSQKDSEKKSVIIIENKIEYFIELIFKPVNP